MTDASSSVLSSPSPSPSTSTADREPATGPSTSTPSKRPAPWTIEADAMIIDGALRGETHAMIAEGLVGRSQASVDQRLTRLVHVKRDTVKLPLCWKKTEAIEAGRGNIFTEAPFTDEEDEELVAWLLRGCFGLRGEIFNDGHSREGLRKRLSELEQMAGFVSDRETKLIIQGVDQCRLPSGIDPDWEAIARFVAEKTGKAGPSPTACFTVATLELGGWDGQYHPNYVPWHDDRRGWTQYRAAAATKKKEVKAAVVTAGSAPASGSGTGSGVGAAPHATSTLTTATESAPVAGPSTTAPHAAPGVQGAMATPGPASAPHGSDTPTAPPSAWYPVGAPPGSAPATLASLGLTLDEINALLEFNRVEDDNQTITDNELSN
ncbi:MAG: hypothetical protein M1838_002343 [Thelocarpon superellum]|nr:MAG: hypothetical protein M1838_002343 [Thelocarpon superellum]